MAANSMHNYDSRPPWRERAARVLSGKPANHDLCRAIAAGQLGVVEQLLSAPQVDLEDPVFFDRIVDGKSYRLWRTPLEYAIDHHANPIIVQLLLQHGARPTFGAAHLAIEGVNPDATHPSRNALSNAQEIVRVLSATGITWQQMPYVGEEGWTSLADKAAQFLGPERALDLGVKGAVWHARQQDDLVPQPVV